MHDRTNVTDDGHATHSYAWYYSRRKCKQWSVMSRRDLKCMMNCASSQNNILTGRPVMSAFIWCDVRKTSPKVIWQNNLSNKLLCVVFWLELDKNTAHNNLLAKTQHVITYLISYLTYVDCTYFLQYRSSIALSPTFFSFCRALSLHQFMRCCVYLFLEYEHKSRCGYPFWLQKPWRFVKEYSRSKPAPYSYPESCWDSHHS